MELKGPLTFEEQIKKLKSHGMIIDDEEKVTYTINDFACYDPDTYCYLG